MTGLAIQVRDRTTLDLPKLRALHTEGLRRVSAVVDGNSNYDELLEFRLTEEDRAAYGPTVSLDRKRRLACDQIRHSLLGKAHKVILPQFQGFASEGRTTNNDREYQFFERICAPLGMAVQRQNYSDCTAIGMGKCSDAEQALLAAVAESAEEYYHGRLDITAGLVRQLTLYSVSYFRFVVAFHRKGAVWPAALVQANDHSPVRVAMSMTMKSRGVPRIYLQHAEVTSSFPPLDFEYSVLRNSNSKAVYGSIGPLTGQVFVIPRYEEAFAGDRLTAERSAPVTVVIYPTSRVVAEQLKRIIGALKDNPQVGDIIVKQHPAAAKLLQQVLSDEGVSFAESIPHREHVALVSNSSVVTELLHRGVPVYQNFDFDPVVSDYYGFVARRLTIEVTQEQLTGEFWQRYALSAEWLATFKELDSTVDSDYQADQDQFLAEMQRLRAASVPGLHGPRMRGSARARMRGGLKRAVIALVNASPAISGPAFDIVLSASSRLGSFLTLYSYQASHYLRNRTNIGARGAQWPGGKAPSGPRLGSSDAIPLLERTLQDVRDPAAWVAANEEYGVFADDLVIRALENLFQDRRTELARIFDSFEVWPEGAAVGTWIYLKRAEWGNISLTGAELERLSSYIHGLAATQFAKPLLERSLLAALIRCGTVEQLESFWTWSSAVTKDTIGTNTKISLLQKLYAQPDRVAQAVELRNRYEQNSSPFELLKLRNMDYLSGRRAPGWSHAVAEQQFESLAPKAAAREFTRIARPFYARFSDKMSLMEVRTDAAQSRSILDQIQQSLEQRAAFSLVRLSDGEGYLFPELPHFTHDDARNRERHWWGTELPPELAADVIAAARAAVTTADIVGIPAVYRFIRDTNDTTRALSQSLQGRGLLQVLAGLPSSVADYARISEDKVNVSVFGKIGNVLSLASSAKRTYVVGSVKPEHLPRQLADLASVETIAIPTHARTSLNDRYESNTVALPYVYEQVLEHLDTAGPGDLVLVAGGIIGKIMLGRARDRGAVAIDIGSVLDDWVSNDQKSLR